MSSVLLLICDRLFATPWTAAHPASLSVTRASLSLPELPCHYQSLFKPICIELMRPSNYLILCRPLFLLSSIFPSIRVFPNDSVLHIRWPKYWNFSFNISHAIEYSALISFRTDWLDLLVSSNTTVQKHQFFSTQLSL